MSQPHQLRKRPLSPWQAPRGCAALAICLVIVAVPAHGQDDFYVRQLKEAGVPPTREGVTRYLRTCLPSDAKRQEASELVAQLKSPRFDERERATAQLVAMPQPPLDLLRAAGRSTDTEVRRRAAHILSRIERGEHRRLLLAVLKTIRQKKLPGQAPLLLELLPTMDPSGLADEAAEAIVATARREDAELFREAVRGGSGRAPAVALAALASVLGEEAVPELVACLQAERQPERVRLAAARSLANLGRRECFPTLAQLLESEDLSVRLDSVRVLYALTRRQFGFVAYEQAEKRAEAVAAWRRWIAQHGPQAKLYYPLQTVKRDQKRILLCVWSEKKLVEIDLSGKVLFSVAGFSYPWGCQGLSNGHRLIADAAKKAVIEYDLEGKECWRKGDLPGRPTSVQRLDNGNTLLALSDGQKVVEISPSGETVWQVALTGRPTTAQRLPNGRTLVNLQRARQVVEIDRQGNKLWELNKTDNAITAEGLENGRVLVCEMKQGKVLEYDRAGNVVWSKEGFSNPAQAQRLSNGHTLVADNKGLHELNLAGDRVWHHSVSRSRFCRF